MIPSGYKPEKVYSVLPTNGDGDLFFDRNTPATRVNKDGLIEQVGTDVPTLDYSDGSCPSLLLERYSLNLALYSEDFTNTFWATGGTIRTSGFLSPSGELNACLVKDEGSNYMASSGMSLISSRTYTLSVYLKASTPTTITLKLQELGGVFLIWLLCFCCIIQTPGSNLYLDLTLGITTCLISKSKSNP